MKCALHLDRDAVAVCNHCGKSVCSDCQVQLKNETYCKDCIRLKLGEGATRQGHSPVLAACLSFVVGGLGQIYNGQIGKGLLIFFTWWLIIPWLIGIFDAYKTAKAIKEGRLEIKKRPGCMITAAVGIVVFIFGIFFLSLLAAIAIPNFLRARMQAREAQAQQTLESIAEAIEAYRLDHNGDYPLKEASLTDSAPPYLSEAYDNTVRLEYIFTEDLRADGYKITATPTECMVTGEKTFVMETGGRLSSQACSRE